MLQEVVQPRQEDGYVSSIGTELQLVSHLLEQAMLLELLKCMCPVLALAIERRFRSKVCCILVTCDNMVSHTVAIEVHMANQRTPPTCGRETWLNKSCFVGQSITVHKNKVGVALRCAQQHGCFTFSQKSGTLNELKLSSSSCFTC